MEIMFRLTALALTAALCGAVVRRGAAEFSLLLSLAAGGCILWLIMGPLEQVLDSMDQMAQLAGLDKQVLTPVWKTVALSVLTRMTGELCRSVGESGIAAFVETAGTILALTMVLPLAQGVLELMTELLT